MHVSECICVHMSAFVLCVCVCASVHLCARACVYVHVYVHKCMHVSARRLIYVYVCGRESMCMLVSKCVSAKLNFVNVKRLRLKNRKSSSSQMLQVKKVLQ